jgi:KipI family sensor histidine kinase inhibitor
MSGRVLPSGPRAVLIEYDTLDEVMRAAATLRARAPDEVIDIVPAARTILVTVRGGVDPAEVIEALSRRSPADATTEQVLDPQLVEIDVVYDGEDLEAVAAACQLTVDEVVALHSAADYTVAFCGFVPGFSYLVGLDRQLYLPRRATPRTRVPGGAVAIASEFSAVYPAAGPGGWHLLGRTDAVMWDDERPTPALLPPGTCVRFVSR